MVLLKECIDHEFTPSQRRWMFRLVCVVVRLGIATAATIVYETTDDETLEIALAMYMFGTALSFIVNYMRTQSGNKTVGGFGGTQWWHFLRPIHALIYISVGTMILTRPIDYAPALLYIDVIIGAVASYFYQE